MKNYIIRFLIDIKILIKKFIASSFIPVQTAHRKYYS